MKNSSNVWSKAAVGEQFHVWRLGHHSWLLKSQLYPTILPIRSSLNPHRNLCWWAFFCGRSFVTSRAGQGTENTTMVHCSWSLCKAMSVRFHSILELGHLLAFESFSYLYMLQRNADSRHVNLRNMACTHLLSPENLHFPYEIPISRHPIMHINMHV